MTQSVNVGGGSQAMSLSRFTAAIGQAVRMVPMLQGAWVVAELSDVRYSGGHCYMELIEKNESGQTVAKLRANIWANRVQQLRRKFFTATGRDIVNGMKVMLFGAATHHPLYGLAFNINDIDPSYTLGDMERLRREILERLSREGVEEQNKSLEMPIAPQRIAVISAEGAAGYGDFMNQLQGNSYGFVFYPHLFQAVMQGDKTSGSVREALDYIEQTIDLWDCVAIMRGGGSTTDLNGFDDYELAKAVATFPLPIVVGIGHERDRTVLDEIAHTRMKTPTAVASYFIERLSDAYSMATDLADSVARYCADRLKGEHLRLANCEAMIPALVKARLDGAAARLERDMMRIPMVVSGRIGAERGKIESLSLMLSAVAPNALQRADVRLKSLSDMIDVLSPQNTLKRGYSITRVDGKAVTSIDSLKEGDILETTLWDGVIKSTLNPKS